MELDAGHGCEAIDPAARVCADCESRLRIDATDRIRVELVSTEKRKNDTEENGKDKKMNGKPQCPSTPKYRRSAPVLFWGFTYLTQANAAKATCTLQAAATQKQYLEFGPRLVVGRCICNYHSQLALAPRRHLDTICGF